MAAKSNISDYRARLHELVDLLCDYFEDLDSRPAKASVLPGHVREALGSEPPQTPIPWAETKQQVLSVVLESANHWQHPRNHGYFPCSTSFPAIMGEMIAKTLNNPGFSWHVSPINTELEILMSDWLAGALGLPEFYKHSSRQGGGLTHGAASEALLVALIGARSRKSGQQMVLYASELAHFSSFKAAKILNIEFRPVTTCVCPRTGNYVMDVIRLSEMIAEDKSAGKTPIMVVATWGSTASCSLDPLRLIGEITQREGLWLHVDAAYAGSALICPEFRTQIDGLELTNSFNFNGHKMLLTGGNNSVLYVKEPQFLTQALSATATYIIPSKPEETDFMSWQIPQGRDFRSIRWWMLLSQYGVEGLQRHVRKNFALAQKFDGLVRSSEELEVPFLTEFGLVAFVVKNNDALTRKLAGRLQERKDTIFTSAEIKGRKILRLVVCSEYTEEEHISQAFAVVCEELAAAKQI